MLGAKSSVRVKRYRKVLCILFIGNALHWTVRNCSSAVGIYVKSQQQRRLISRNIKRWNAVKSGKCHITTDDEYWRHYEWLSPHYCGEGRGWIGCRRCSSTAHKTTKACPPNWLTSEQFIAVPLVSLIYKIIGGSRTIGLLLRHVGLLLTLRLTSLQTPGKFIFHANCKQIYVHSRLKWLSHIAQSCLYTQIVCEKIQHVPLVMLVTIYTKKNIVKPVSMKA